MAPFEIEMCIEASHFNRNVTGEMWAHFNAPLMNRMAQSKKARKIKAKDLWSTVGGEHQSKKHARLSDPNVVDLAERRKFMRAYKENTPKPRLRR